MLVLSRKLGEAIVLPRLAVVVKVIDVRGSRVRLAIDAPASVSVVRRSIQQASSSSDLRADVAPKDG